MQGNRVVGMLLAIGTLFLNTAFVSGSKPCNLPGPPVTVTVSKTIFKDNGTTCTFKIERTTDPCGNVTEKIIETSKICYDVKGLPASADSYQLIQ